MQPDRFDSISRYFAGRRLSRRRALTETGAGLAAAGLAAAGLATATSAQDATPAAAGTEPVGGNHGPATLFVQTYQSGTIAPKEGAPDRYTLTLEQGHGQTIYFSDRPDRIVGATPTGQFLESIGFPEDNPPNAALIVETAPGESDIAVVELFAPVFNADTAGVTYEVEVLANWQADLEMDFAEAPADLAALAPSFGSAQLFIDDCPDATMRCRDRNSGDVVGEIPNEDHDGYCYSYFNVACLPCAPAWDYQGNENQAYWGGQCAARFEACANDACYLTNFCSRDAPLGNTLCKRME